MIITEKKRRYLKKPNKPTIAKIILNEKKKKGVFSTGIKLRNRTSYLLVADQAL